MHFTLEMMGEKVVVMGDAQGHDAATMVGTGFRLFLGFGNG
jgi:hypothetical protein